MKKYLKYFPIIFFISIVFKSICNFVLYLNLSNIFAFKYISMYLIPCLQHIDYDSVSNVLKTDIFGMSMPGDAIYVIQRVNMVGSERHPHDQFSRTGLRPVYLLPSKCCRQKRQSWEKVVSSRSVCCWANTSSCQQKHNPKCSFIAAAHILIQNYLSSVLNYKFGEVQLTGQTSC